MLGSLNHNVQVKMWTVQGTGREHTHTHTHTHDSPYLIYDKRYFSNLDIN